MVFISSKNKLSAIMTLGFVLCAAQAMSDDPAKNIADAEQAMTTPLLSVTQSPIQAPSGDPHDYITMATYAWPNPNSSNGLPYINRDGQTNPETEKYPDRKNLDSLITAVRHLAAGYNANHDERYANKAIQLITTWFLIPETHMNPNLNYSQITPGKNNGLGNYSGIIETGHFVDLIEALDTIEKSPNASDQFKTGLRKWFSEYLNWLQTSPNGRKAAGFKNNQLTWFTAQQVAISEFIGDSGQAKNILAYYAQYQLPNQLNADGSQPEELARTKSFNYSLVNINGLFALARIGEKIGVDLWHYKTSNHSGIEDAIDFLIPFASGQKPWPYQEIQPYDPSLLKSVLGRAIKAYPERQKVYQNAIDNMKVF